MTEHPHDVTITVNGKTVIVPGPRITGLEIKTHAIAQAVAIGLDFILSLELGDRRSRVIGDDEVITVRPHSKFIAVAPDDNS